jgi:hypothetical protein
LEGAAVDVVDYAGKEVKRELGKGTGCGDGGGGCGGGKACVDSIMIRGGGGSCRGS